MKLKNKKFIHEGEPVSQVHEHDIKQHNSQFPKASQGAQQFQPKGMEVNRVNRETDRAGHHQANTPHKKSK